MAMFRAVLHNLSKQYNNFTPTGTLHWASKTLSNGPITALPVQKPGLPILNCWRFSHSFVSRLTAAQLWKGVTSVSPAGRRKGRGRASGRKQIKDLNRGQVLGFGRKNMLWPGLNAPVVQGREILRQQALPRDEEREKRILELRDRGTMRRSFQIHPLDRGWSGKTLPGRSLGPPKPVGEETFEGFDSRVLEFKPVMHMSGTRGRIRSLSAFVVVGNKNGLGGFALAKSPTGMSAAQAARNKAAQRLRYVERDNNTILHDFFCEFGAVKIFVKKMPEGHGLVCHRAIKAICEVVGIKDLYAKAEGPTRNTQCLTKAFFIGLMRQRSFQQIANEKGLHIVEMRKDRDNFPVVIASPEKCRTEEEIGSTELLDYTLHLHQGRAEAECKKYQPFYINYPSFIKEMKNRESQRNQRKVHIHLLAKYGARKSFIQVREEEKARKELKKTIES